MPIVSAFTGILPTAWVASVWKMIPFSFASFPIAAMSWIVPISLFANMTEMRIVLSVIAFLDRKSTRLNSSHSSISYAVFCLKKKKKKKQYQHAIKKQKHKTNTHA